MGHSVFVPHQSGLVWEQHGRQSGNRSGWRGWPKPSSQGRREHGLHLFPLLPAVVQATPCAVPPSLGAEKGKSSTSCPFSLLPSHLQLNPSSEVRYVHALLLRTLRCKQQ